MADDDDASEPNHGQFNAVLIRAAGDCGLRGRCIHSGARRDGGNELTTLHGDSSRIIHLNRNDLLRITCPRSFRRRAGRHVRYRRRDRHCADLVFAFGLSLKSATATSLTAYHSADRPARRNRVVQGRPREHTVRGADCARHLYRRRIRARILIAIRRSTWPASTACSP